MYEITYLPIAEQDIAEIIIYISNQLKAPKAAIELLDAFDHSILLLQEFPYTHKIYRLTKPLEEEYRLLPVKNYAVFYVVREHVFGKYKIHQTAKNKSSTPVSTISLSWNV